MVLYKLQDFDPNYQDTIEGKDIKGLGVYTEGTDQKIGTVFDVLVDDDGHFRYLVIDLGFWIFGKKVLLPIGRSHIDHDRDRVYTIGLTRQQAEDLPEFNERLALDQDYEERVRGIYRNPNYRTEALESAAPVESRTPVGTSAAPVESRTPVGASSVPVESRTPVGKIPQPENGYAYEDEPTLFGLNEKDHQTLRLYEERLIANKRRQKVGEVAIGKHIETETAKVAVPVERERVVIERVKPKDAGRVVSSSEADFGEGEVARLEIYEETPEIRKEAVLREEVRVKKVVDQNTVESQETLRREELDVNAPGQRIEER
jgi:uncharacterized protein (TIGR02271 family)